MTAFSSGDRGRFVVLLHDWPHTHWDLMLELGGVLKTWRLSSEPPAPHIAAEPLPDHRIAYLDYEGPLSGGRGQVSRTERGTFEVVSASPSSLSVQFEGNQWRGEGVWDPHESIWDFHC